MPKKLLIIEDEHSIATLLSYNLVQAGYETIIANDGKQGYDLALSEKPDLIVLDLMLPSMDGVEVCKSLRQQKVNTPIIMLTAKGDEFDKVLGLELGADDYMTKPFSPREVVARIKAVLPGRDKPCYPARRVCSIYIWQAANFPGSIRSVFGRKTIRIYA